MTFFRVKKYVALALVICVALFSAMPLFASIEIVNINDSEEQATNSFEDDSFRSTSTVTEDGRYVVFMSSADNLVLLDISGHENIFMRDRELGTTELISMDSDEAAVNNNSEKPLVSTDGRYVVFESIATNLVASDSNATIDIFIRDRELGTTARLNVSTASVQANGPSSQVSMSSDARYASFSSTATNLVASDGNGVIDVFVRDTLLNTTTILSVNNLGDEGDAGSADPKVSDNGTYIAFYSDATNLVGGDGNAAGDIFVYNTSTLSLERIEIGAIVTVSGISNDGRLILFSSDAALVAGDTNGTTDVFLYDRSDSSIEAISVNTAETIGNSASVQTSMTTDGRYVVFLSASTNLVDNDGNATHDVFIRDRILGTTERMSESLAGVEGDDISYTPYIGSLGRYVAFSSYATNLIDDVSDDFEFQDVFFYIHNLAPTDITLSNDTLDENESAGFVIGGLTTTDADVGDTHTYTLACTVPGADDASFSISSSSLLSAASFNYEAQSSYSICIRTTDNFGATFDENFTITVQDVGEGSTGSTPNDRDRGCTSDTALNYDPDAEVDDGSCLYPDDSVPGCTDPTATNFNVLATTNNGSCTYNTPPTPVPGCMDSTANNFNAAATVGDGSCTYPPVLPPTSGCTDSVAINFNSAATSNDGSCVYPPTVTSGCLDPLANNYDPSVTTSDGSCVFDPNIPTDDPADPEGDPGGEGTRSFVDKQIQKAFKNPIPPPTQNTLVVTGLVLSISSLVIRIWNMIPILLGLRRRRRPWGTVYDSVTKQPLDPVYVTLQDASGNEAGQSITDLDGRYGFWVPPGLYSLLAGKSDYVFPSVKLAGKDHDDLYDNLYFGGSINVEREDEIINKNIPMDALNFNWNEFEKAKNKRLMKFFSKGELFLSRIGHVLFAAGFISSILLSYFEPRLLNHLVLGLYIAILALALWGVRPKKPGFVVEKETGMPLSFGILSVYSALLQKEISHAVVGKTGRYYMLVQKGEYYLTLRKKTGENSYEEIFKSEPFSARKGYINKTLRV